MDSIPSSSAGTVRDDRILPITRWIIALVILFLIPAFIILYIYPDQSGQRFAWEIKPHMTAMFIGAGYLGGAYQFVRLVFERHWHRVGRALLPVTAFTIAMLLATILHWERFDIHHPPFQTWLALYVITPFLVPWLWWNNHATDPGAPEQHDLLVPRIAQLGFMLAGISGALFAIFVFLAPQIAISFWPWTLTPLTAHVLAGWFSLLGAGGLVLAPDPRWSAWRIQLESITLWGLLILIAANANPQDFISGSIINWFTLSLGLGLLIIIVFYISMEFLRRRAKH